MNQHRKEFEEILAREHSEEIPHFNREQQAAVAMVVRDAKKPEILFIQRAENPNDRWSGQMAFPGGRVDEADQSDVSAAIRETSEETGLKLSTNSYIGKLNEVQARRAGKLLSFKITPHLFFIDEHKQDLQLDASEVAAAFWIPLEHILLAENHISFTFERDNFQVHLPGIQFESNKIWGLSYMMLTDFVFRFQQTSLMRSLVDDLSFWSLYPSLEVKN